MTTPAQYTFEVLRTPFAIDHALRCLNKRPDDFIEMREVSQGDLTRVGARLFKADLSLKFILVYENGQLIDQVGVVRVFHGDTVDVVYGISAPVKGSMSYVYGNIFSELLEFLSSEGYVKFTTTYIKGHAADSLYSYYSKAFPQYNFSLEDYSSIEKKLTVDLVNLKEDL